MKFAERMNAVKPSATLAITSLAKELKAKGKDVISFGAGEPDFDTPEFIVDAMVEAARSGATRYAPVAGLPELREAVAKDFTKLYGVDFTPDQIMVSCGGKHSLYNLFQVLVDPGDEVIIPTPYWVSYPAQVKLAKGWPVFVDAVPEEGFRIDPSSVHAAITDKTVGIVLNSPNNPTGAVQSAEDLRAIAHMAAEHDMWIITDDIYSYIRYGDGEFVSVLRECPELRDRIIVVHGASKTFAMTGWRIGFTGARADIIKKMSTLQGQATSGANTFAQKGAVAAVNSDLSFLDEWLAAYGERRRRIVDGLNAIEGITCAEPGGAFYVFPDVRGLLHKSYEGTKIETDFALCETLIEHALIACVPGQPFGAPGFMRMSYACSMEDIDKGLERLAEFVSKLQ
ncbi:MAG: pyridoxal phosphate-dependent aminotransferase [Myxococcota bacterium]